jgi:hypothetical protein
MDSIDKLLAQVKAKYQEPTEPEQPKQQLQAEPLKQPPPKQEPFVDSLLAQVKANYDKQDRAEEQQLKAEQLKQQKLQQQQLKALTLHAKAWLEKLDPLSSEGIWFEKFAEKYSSKLAAAIDYLSDL